jgi:hypothetical protein
METALYYPYIRVPETSWFTQILLYWDRAATIVPERSEGWRDLRTPYMIKLEAAGLYRPVFSGTLWEDSEAFSENFLALIEGSRQELTNIERSSMANSPARAENG